MGIGTRPERESDPWTEYIDSALVWRPLERSRLPKSGRVLDLGCGDGRIAVALATDGYRALGADLTPGPGPRVLARAEALPFRDATFDAILIVLVLMHIRSARRALGEARRVLKEGGTLLLAVGNRRSFTGLAFRESSERFLNRRIPYDYYLSYSKEELSDLLSSTGFKVDSIECTTFVPRIFGKASPSVVRGMLALARPVEGMLRRLPGIRSMGIRLVAIAEARPT